MRLNSENGVAEGLSESTGPSVSPRPRWAPWGSSDEPLSPQQFNERYNLAYQAPDTPRASVRQVTKHYVASVAVYGCLLLFVTHNPWFKSLLEVSYKGTTAGQIYDLLFQAYAYLALPVLLITRPRSLWCSKNLLILGYLGRLAAMPFRRDARSAKPDYRESQALMFLLIKLIYGPLMLHAVFLELERLPGFWFRLKFQSDWLTKLDYWYLMAISTIFLIDSSLFFFGYTTEAGWLGNRLRYCETDVFRILVCLACYEPFNLVTGHIAGLSYGHFGILYQRDLEHPMTWILRGLAVLFLLLMISTSLSLFTRASNLTNRGIVKHGPYAVVRHPGYLAKNMFWLMTIIPLFVPNTEAIDFSWSAHALVCVGAAMGWLAWASLYFLRAITEEQFLSKDPEYVAYCQKVRYRFIPGVY